MSIRICDFLRIKRRFVSILPTTTFAPTTIATTSGNVGDFNSVEICGTEAGTVTKWFDVMVAVVVGVVVVGSVVAVAYS